jgi:hypothetical protein
MLKKTDNDMDTDKVLYTDGHDVTVTDSTLQVKKNEYKLNGVTRCGLMVLRPQRAPGIVLLILGLAAVIVGLLQLIPAGTFPDIQIANKSLSANAVAVWLGVTLALIGILVLGLVRERYSVRIATAEGERDAVVSDKREYISQIVDAINQAISYVRTKTASRYFTVKTASPGKDV